MKLFSSKTFIRGKHPLHAASRVINASASATSAFARCWVHSTNRTTALIRSVRNEGFRRAYSGRHSAPHNHDNGGFHSGPSPESASMYSTLSVPVCPAPISQAGVDKPRARTSARCLEGNSNEVVSAPAGRGGPAARRHAVSQAAGPREGGARGRRRNGGHKAEGAVAGALGRLAIRVIGELYSVVCRVNSRFMY